MSDGHSVSLIKCTVCKATVKNHYWSKMRANKEGWFFKRDGTAYCPEHLPEWLHEWRAKK
jgi:hypothetical protein